MSPEVPTFVRALLATCLEPPGPCLICISFTQMFIKINALRHNICLHLILLERRGATAPGEAPSPHPSPRGTASISSSSAPPGHSRHAPGLQSKEGKSCDVVLEREFVGKSKQEKPPELPSEHQPGFSTASLQALLMPFPVQIRLWDCAPLR